MASNFPVAMSAASKFFTYVLGIEGCLREMANARTIGGPRFGSASLAMAANSAETP